MPSLSTEDVLHVSTARVAVADYEVLQHDFEELRTDNLALFNPQLLDLAPDARHDVVHSIIDEWLIANAAFISTAQARQTLVNTTIETDQRPGIAYRPPRYGRALVIPVHDDRCHGVDGQRWTSSAGLLDVKGAGVAPDRAPSHETQQNGLEHLGIALRDFLFKKAIDEICARWAPTVWTVPVYGVLDFGFDICDASSRTAAAGLHVRRAHRRQIEVTNEPIGDAVRMEIETMLRRYGITSVSPIRRMCIGEENGSVSVSRGDHQKLDSLTPAEIGVCLTLVTKFGPVSIDRLDIQLAREITWPPASGQLFDFGTFRVESRFEYALSMGRVSIERIIWPDAAAFVQPDPALRLPFETWRRAALSEFCFGLARQFRNQEISSRELLRKLEEPVQAAVDRWPKELNSSRV